MLRAGVTLTFAGCAAQHVLLRILRLAVILSEAKDLVFDLRGMRLLQYSLKPGDDKKTEVARFQSALAGAIEAVARSARADPVYSQLYQYSTRMAGQVIGIIRDLLKVMCSLTESGRNRAAGSGRPRE